MKLARRWMFALIAAVGVQAGAMAPGQTLKPASATLPESNEGLLLVNAAEDAIRAGDYRLALEQIDRLMRLRGELVGGAASRTYVPVWREGVRLLTPLPPDALRLYRDLYDAEVATRFDKARSSGEVSELEELFRIYRLSASWPAIGADLAARLLDKGVFGRALEVLEELARTAGPAELPEVQLRLAAAYALTGALDRARAAAAAIDAPNAPAALQARIKAVREWLSTTTTSSAPAGDGDFVLSPLWTQSLPSQAVVQRGDEEILDAIDMLRRLPLYEPVLTPNDLIIRLRGRVSVLDANTLSLRWTAQEHLAEGQPSEPEPSSEGAITLSRDTDQLLQAHLRHAVGCGFGMVFTIEGGRTDPRTRGVTFTVDERGRNELVARDLATGALRWRSGDDATDSLYDVEFQDRPLALDGRLMALFQRAGEVRLADIDPQTGRCRREVLVVGLPTHFDSNGYGGRCLLAADETTIFVCTGNGVIAALEREDLAWKWATVYDSTLEHHLGRLWWQPEEQPVESGVDRPILAGDLLIVAPQDSTSIYALNRYSGQERWHIDRRENSFVVGISDGGLIVGGPYLSSIDIHDPVGKPLHWKSVPLEVSGRPVLKDGRVYTPTRSGTVVVDARTGKVVAEDERAAKAGTRAQSANLVAGADALFEVSTREVVKYPRISGLRQTAERLAAEGDLLRSAIVSGWADVFDGKPEQALARIEREKAPSTDLANARAALLLRVFERLAEKSDDKQRLAWLRKAGEVADRSGGGGALAVALGAQIEQAAGPAEALDFHFARLLSNGDETVADPQDATRQFAGWVHAARRIAALLPKLPEADAGARVERAISAARQAAQPVVAMHRLLVATRGTRWASDVALAALGQKVAPELAAGYLPLVDETRLTAEQRRTLAVTRWEVSLSLGDLEAAQRDHKTLAALGSAPAETQDDARLSALDVTQRKLIQAAGPPLGPRLSRQWKFDFSELLWDPHAPRVAGRNWALVRARDKLRIELRRVGGDGLAIQQTEDAIVHGAPPRPPQEMRLLINRGLALPDLSWPMVTYDHLAAVPVLGGLICVGLGPERYAGRRLWELPVPAWTGFPREFARQGAGGSLGVYFTPRHNRVALVGWADGQIWWERDFPNLNIASLSVCGDDLIVLGEDHQVWAIDAAAGDRLRRLERPAVRDAEVSGDTLLVWEEASAATPDALLLSAYRTRDFHLQWSTPTRAIRGRRVFENAGIVLATSAPDDGARLLNAASGAAVLPNSLRDAGELLEIAPDGDAIWLAGRAVDPIDGSTPLIRISVLERGNGQVRWRRDVPSASTFNLTQLTGNPTYVPVLVETPLERERAHEPRRPPPRIVLIEKQTGNALEPRSLAEEFRSIDTPSDTFLVATPSRLIVQVAGNVLGFGSSTAEATP